MSTSSTTTGHAGHSGNDRADALARTPADVDPTRTKTLRRRYAQRLRGRIAEINTEVRRGVRDRDVFGLELDLDRGRRRGRAGEALAERVPAFRFETDDRKIEAFRDWLDRQLDQEVLSVISTDRNQWIQAAYGRGLQHAQTALRDSGIQVSEQEVQSLFNQPVHQDTVQRLYTRNFQALEGITDEVGKQISRELADGFAQGVGPEKMARSITDRIDSIGKTRATVLARTEVINAHSEATLNRFEEHSVDEVTIKAEFTTAGDARVCPLCLAREGEVVTIQEARTETFEFSPGEDQPSSLAGEYPIKPPIHPQCRCAWLPVVS